MDLKNIEVAETVLRVFEQEAAIAMKEGRVKGASHFSQGNESQLIKIFRGLRREDYLSVGSAISCSREQLIDLRMVEVSDNANFSDPVFTRGINDKDWVCASYRNHYHALLKGVQRDWLMNEVLEGRSMTPINLDHRFVASGIVSGQIPIALGIAKALQMQESPNHVYAFCGDMAAETGVFYESIKYAQNYRLPITFIVEDNGLSVQTSTQEVWGGQEDNLRPNTIRYKYKIGTPHQGVGKEVGF